MGSSEARLKLFLECLFFLVAPLHNVDRPGLRAAHWTAGRAVDHTGDSAGEDGRLPRSADRSSTLPVATGRALEKTEVSRAPIQKEW